MSVLCCKKTVVDRKWHERTKKRINTEQKWIKGENPGISLKKIPPGAWMSVSCECCVLSGRRGLCDELIPRPEESYRLWCVSTVCDHETSTKREEAQAHIGLSSHTNKKIASFNKS
jgi:hypothetical protein